MSNLPHDTSLPTSNIAPALAGDPDDSLRHVAITRGQRISRVFAPITRFLKVLAPYVTVQIIVQILGAVVGFLIVRSLSLRENAIYTIAITTQATLMSLADVGITSALSGTGGRVWQDPHRFGQLIKTGLQLRAMLALVILVFAVPIMAWMFLKNGVSILYTLLMMAALLMGAGARLNCDILSIVPKIKGQANRLQTFDLIGAVLRLAFIAVLYVTKLNAFLAVLTASIAAYAQNIQLLKWVKEDIVWEAPPNNEDKSDIIVAIKKQFFNTLYYCAQGQITLAVISMFGNTNNIAEIGALGKISVLFTIISSIFANLVMPRFARESSWRNLLRIYYISLAGLTLFSGILMTIVVLFPNAVLWVLGPSYQHLQTQLGFAIFAAIIMSFTGLLFGLNAARTWFGRLWITIPIMIVSQVILAYVLDLKKIENVMMLTSIPYAISCIVPIYTFIQEINKMKQEENKLIVGA